MGQDSKTGGQGLYVETIEIDPEGGENVIFPCNAWSEEDDLNSQRDIYPQPEYQGEPKPSKWGLQKCGNEARLTREENPRLRKRWRLYIFPLMHCGPKSLRKRMNTF